MSLLGLGPEETNLAAGCAQPRVRKAGWRRHSGDGADCLPLCIAVQRCQGARQPPPEHHVTSTARTKRWVQRVAAMIREVSWLRLCSQNMASCYAFAQTVHFTYRHSDSPLETISPGSLSPSVKLNPTTGLLSNSTIRPAPLCHCPCE